MQSILNDIAARFQLTRKAGKWTGPCPKCGGSGQSDKFQIRDDGGFKCYGCDFKGDLITWLREMDGKSCPEAHELAGIACRASLCPAAGTCRFGDGSGSKPLPRKSSVSPVPSAKTAMVPTTQAKTPQQVWEKWAAGVMAAGQEEIQRQKAVLTWLSSRGIDAAAVERFGLGWQRKNDKVERAAIGLQPVEGKPTLWVPAGLIITVFDAAGSVHRLRIRRPGWARKDFLPDLKYVWIEGSGTEPMVIRPLSGVSRGWAVVEAELDGMACAAAHDDVTVLALGTVKAPITEAMRQELQAAPVLLICLDADPGKNGKKGPGPEAVAAWRREFRQARFWPVPAGKDPGDYVKEHHGDLHAWLEAGLPPAVSPAVAPAVIDHEPMIFPVCATGGKGEGLTGQTGQTGLTGPAGLGDDGAACGNGDTVDGKRNIPAGGDADAEAGNKTIELLDGRVFHVVHDKATWLRLVESGELVFSVNELQRLLDACSGCGDKEREEAAMAALAVKEVFPGSYVRNGRVKQR